MPHLLEKLHPMRVRSLLTQNNWDRNIEMSATLMTNEIWNDAQSSHWYFREREIKWDVLQLYYIF